MSEPWRTQGEYHQDRFRMKLMVIASIISALSAFAAAAVAVAIFYSQTCP
jgi:hypothetical protein